MNNGLRLRIKGRLKIGDRLKIGIRSRITDRMRIGLRPRIGHRLRIEDRLRIGLRCWVRIGRSSSSHARIRYDSNRRKWFRES